MNSGGLRVNEDEKILTQTFDASTGDFGTPNLLNPAAFTATGGKTGFRARSCGRSTPWCHES